MKIKRYFAPDIKQAIRMVREEQGPDAVILSNRKVDGGVEIVAARDFDEQVMVQQVPGAANSHSIPVREADTSKSGEACGKTESRKRTEEVFREALRASPNPGRISTTPNVHNSTVRELPEQTARSRVVEQPAATPRERSSGEGVAGKALRELHTEMRQMRRMLDAHFSETAWDSATRNAPNRLDLLRQLSHLGFSKKLALQIANRLGAVEDFSLAWQACRDLLGSQLPIVEDNVLDYGGVVALVGPTGVGKTTTIAKLAARFRLKHGPRQIALITTDNYRIGAHDQLTTYGRILDVPVRSAANGEELRHLLAGFCDKRLVLIDTAGMAPRDLRLAEQFAVLRHDDIPIKPYLVLSAASQSRVMEDAIRAFSGFSPKACVLTKLDETAQLGAAISTLIDHQLPISLLTDGQQVPEDLHIARTHLLLERCFSAQVGAGDGEEPDTIPCGYEDWVAYANV